jgi:hypothetical protein
MNPLIPVSRQDSAQVNQGNQLEEQPQEAKTSEFLERRPKPC